MQALCLFFLLVYVHAVVSGRPTGCLQHLKDSWPRDGILRVEIISNLHLQLSQPNGE